MAAANDDTNFSAPWSRSVCVHDAEMKTNRNRTEPNRIEPNRIDAATMPALHNATLPALCHACDFACQDWRHPWRTPCLVFFILLVAAFVIVFIQLARIMCPPRRFAFIHLNPYGSEKDRVLFGWRAPPSKYTVVDESTIAPSRGATAELEVIVTGGSGSTQLQ